MFQKNLFITKGIDESIPKHIINLLWNLIHQQVGKRELDYLQIFEVKTIGTKGEKSLWVHWTQEQPEYSVDLYFPDITTDIDTKIWVICSGEGTEDEYSTMLLPEEY